MHAPLLVVLHTSSWLDNTYQLWEVRRSRASHAVSGPESPPWRKALRVGGADTYESGA
jgi:hypothetical protein